MMKTPVYLYSLSDSSEVLDQEARQWLGPQVSFWSANPIEFQLGQGLPANWRDQGAVFSERGELRWEMEDDVYQALLILDQPIPARVSQEGWSASQEVILLQDLEERRVAPLIESYPGVGSAGRLRVKVLQKDGQFMLVSLREFVSRED